MTHVESFVGHTKFKFLLFALDSDGDHHEGILHRRPFVVDCRDRDEAYSDCIHHTCDRIFSATRVLMKFSQHDRRQCVEWLLELWRGFDYVDQPWTDAAYEITMVR